MKKEAPLRIYTNPITGNMVVGLPDGPPLKKFKKGQEAEALAWAEQVLGWYISKNPFSGKFCVDFVPHNGAKPSHGPEFHSLDDAKNHVYRLDKKATISIQ